MQSYVPLSAWQVSLAAALILINGAISLALRLGMERTLLLASARMVAQLLLVGLVLEWVFEVDRWYLVLGLIALMTLIAGYTARQRVRWRYSGLLLNTILSVWSSAWLMGAFALLVVMPGEGPWYEPQYAIPLLGMILGNSLNGISLGLNALLETLTSRRDEVEMLLALGATRWEAAREAVRQAVRTGMVPLINSMLVAGVVSLPGMMTGQILTGVAPLEAVKYQLVIMFLLAAATALGTVTVVLLSYLRLFNRDHQFVYTRLEHFPGD